MGRAMQKGVFGHMQTAVTQISFASLQSDQDLHCSLIESLGTAEHNKYSKVSDRNIYLPWLIQIFTVCIYPEGTFSHVKVHIQGQYMYERYSFRNFLTLDKTLFFYI